jgi:hypothetical protein
VTLVGVLIAGLFAVAVHTIVAVNRRTRFTASDRIAGFFAATIIAVIANQRRSRINTCALFAGRRLHTNL